MRILPFVFTAILTITLIFALNIPLPVAGSKTPCLGSFLSPQHGFWQNAEPTDADFNRDLSFPQLEGKTEVYFDDRLVPHVFAEKENDAYFVQGYLHAKFRLWQMEFQTHAAGGRLSEIMGDSSGGTNFLKIDRFFRRLGMVYGAEQSLKQLEANPITKAETDAYTAGINAYISSLKPNQYPFEYKLLSYSPEPWTNLKTLLFLKYMSYDLAGGDNDFEMTGARFFFSPSELELLSPTHQDSLDPIIPKGTPFPTPSIVPVRPANADSVYYPSATSGETAAIFKPNENNGSNNWAVAGSKTQSGAPILCNDPHLGLNLPSLWYEMQITTPAFSCYGVSFPGAPSIIIGFNNHCAWGVTNAGRDVKDYYQIEFRDNSMKEYKYNGRWLKSSFRKEVIKVKGKADVVENIAMTLFGPVMFDATYPNKLNDGKCYALRWKAHDGSNELLTFNKLNRISNYDEFEAAISTFECPGQNFVFASKSGDIAIQQQGLFPAKWRRQGDFVMPGNTSDYEWQGYIPVNENPRMLNPARGFVSSANQLATDTTYPYYLGGIPEIYRGITINRRLEVMKNISVDDMQALQTDNYNVFAEIARPVLLANLDTTRLSEEQLSYLTALKKWNLQSGTNEIGPTVFNVWWGMLQTSIYQDEFKQTKFSLRWPANSTTLEILLRDSAFRFIDNINTPQKESLHDVMLQSFRIACAELHWQDSTNHLAWGKFKDTGIRHLLKLPSLSRMHLPIGGGANIINATSGGHGPSWRMIVQLTSNIEAYGVYPGGQSGNPGSIYYDTFIDSWANGTYYPLRFFQQETAKTSDEVLWTMTFSKS